MKRRDFLKTLGGLAGLSLVDLDKALAAATKVFDEETQTWYYSVDVEDVENGAYTLSYWKKTETTAWTPHEEIIEVTDNIARIRIPIEKKKEPADLMRLTLEKGAKPAPFDNRWGDPREEVESTEKYIQNQGFTEWKRKK